MPRPITIKQLAQQTLWRLSAAADARVAAQARVYFKQDEDVSFFGVATPVVRRLERELYQQIKSVWTVDEARGYCDLLLRDRRQEARSVGILLFARYHKLFAPELIKDFETWLGGNLCNNWALTDELATCVIALFLRRFPAALPRVAAWTGAENLWLRRAAAVALVPLARKGEALEQAYAIARRLFHYHEDLIHKANGWLLREAGKADAARLKTFLLKYGVQIPRTTVRYAIERFPAVERRALLRQTRA